MSIFSFLKPKKPTRKECGDYLDWDDTLCPMNLQNQILHKRAEGKIGPVYCPKISTHTCPAISSIKKYNRRF